MFSKTKKQTNLFSKLNESILEPLKFACQKAYMLNNSLLMKVQVSMTSQSFLLGLCYIIFWSSLSQYIYMCVYIYMYTHTYKCIDVHIYIIYICIYTYTSYIYAYIYAHRETSKYNIT